MIYNIGCFNNWRGGRVAEGATLERLYTSNRIRGSNPLLSSKVKDPHIGDFLLLGRGENGRGLSAPGLESPEMLNSHFSLLKSV